MTTKTKKQAIVDWANLAPNQPLRPRPIPYKTRGSRYGCDGIRIDGSPEFIDAVLSRLKDLILCENTETRLELSRSRVEGDRFENGYGGEVCYIRVHERGEDSKAVHRFCAALGNSEGGLL